MPSVLLTPKWVTTANMASTVIADQFVKVAQLCVGKYAAALQDRRDLVMNTSWLNSSTAG